MNLDQYCKGFAVQQLREECRGMTTLEIIKQEFAHTLWCDTWYSALEDDEHKTPEQAKEDTRVQSSMSGQKIEDFAPPTPQDAIDFTEAYFTKVGPARVKELIDWVEAEGLPECDIKCLGDCLYYEAVGAGVSWSDDYDSVHPWMGKNKPCGYVEVYAFRQDDGSWAVEGSL